MTWIVRVNLDATTRTVSYTITPRSRRTRHSCTHTHHQHRRPRCLRASAASTRRALRHLEKPINAGRSRPTASAIGASRFHVPSRRVPTTREVSQHGQLRRNPRFPCSRSKTNTLHKGSRILNLCLVSTGSHIIWTPFSSAAGLAAASSDNARATSVKATKPLPCGKMLVIDRQDHENSCPCRRGVLASLSSAFKNTAHAVHVEAQNGEEPITEWGCSWSRSKGAKPQERHLLCLRGITKGPVSLSSLLAFSSSRFKCGPATTASTTTLHAEKDSL